MYYKRNTGGLWLRPGPALSKRVFRSARDFKSNYPQTMFSIYDVLSL